MARLLVIFVLFIYSKLIFSANIHIGGIFSDDGGLVPSSLELAFQLAVEEINNSPSILPSTTIKYYINRTSSLNAFESVRLACYQASLGVASIIGPVTSHNSKHVNSIASTLHIPQITFATTEPSLFGNAGQYPFVVHMSSSDTYQSSALIDLLLHYDWKKVAVLTSATEYGTNGLKAFNSLAMKKGITVTNSLKFIVNDNVTLVDAREQLNTIIASKTRIVILNCLGKFARKVLQQAQALKMTDEGWAWVVTDGSTSLEGLYSGSVPDGWIGLLGTRPTTSYQDATLLGAFKTAWNTKGYGSVPVEPYAYKVWDAVYAFAYGLHKLQTDGRSISVTSLNCQSCTGSSSGYWNDGKKLLDYIKQVDENGLMNKIKFESDGSPTVKEYDVVLLGIFGFEKLADWSESSKIHDVVAGQINWMGRSKNKPKSTSFDISNTTLSIVIMLEEPFMRLREPVGYYTGNDQYEGYCMDLLNEIQKSLGFKYIISLSRDLNWGALDESTGQWNGMVKDLQDGVADMAVTAFTISASRQTAIAFTKPYLDLGLGIIMRKPEYTRSLLAFMDPFTNEVWGLILTTTFFVGLSIYFCNKLSPFGYYGSCIQADPSIVGKRALAEREENMNSLDAAESIWFSMGSLLGQGTDFMPKCVSGRVITGVWWFTGTLFVATYTANLAAFMVIKTPAKTIGSVDELANQEAVQYGTVDNTQVSSFFESSNIPVYSKMYRQMKKWDTLVPDSKSLKAKVYVGQFAGVWDSAVNDYLVQRKPCNLMTVGEPFAKLGYGFGLQMGSPYEHLMSSEILRLREIGFLDKLKEKWFVHKGQCQSSGGQSNLAQVLNLSDSLGPFVMLCGGIFFSLIVLLGEWIVYSRAELKEFPDGPLSFKEAWKLRFSRIKKDIKNNWFSLR